MVLDNNSAIDTVVLMLGTNDCKSMYKASPQIIGKGVEILIEQIKKKNPKIKILLISPILLGEEVWKEEYDPEFDVQSVKTSKELKGEYAKIAKKYDCEFMAASDYASPSRDDQEHLNEEGHRILASVIYEKLNDMLYAS